MIEHAIVAALLAVPAVTNLVGDRIAEQLEQGGPLPAIAYRRISTNAPLDLEGGKSFTRARLELTCWAGDGDAAAAVGDVVRAALNGWSGQLAGEAVNGVFLEDARSVDNSDVPVPGDPTATLKGWQLDFFVMSKEGS